MEMAPVQPSPGHALRVRGLFQGFSLCRDAEEKRPWPTTQQRSRLWAPLPSRDALCLAHSSSRTLQKRQNYLKCLRCSDGEHRFHLKVGAAGVRPAATSIRAPSCSQPRRQRCQARCLGGFASNSGMKESKGV